jgi:tetratricopeptide (TPR) repeat protein
MENGGRIEELFHAALAHAPAARDAFLTASCGGDRELREQVEALLAAHAGAYDFPDEPAWRIAARWRAEQSSSEEDGTVEPGLPYERLGPFRLLGRLGEGGMGVVYLALQEPLGRRAALKVIRPELVGSPESVNRFEREIRAIAGLSHPHIVTVFEAGQERGIHYFAMEFVTGKDLDTLLHEVAAGPGMGLPVNRVVEWIREIAAALDAAHRAGIIHRDVKPSNIRITPEGRAVLMDFGIARQGGLPTLTLTGEFRGTLRYASPEQVKAREIKIDARTDIYSLGVSLYETVTGLPPFEGETTEQVMRNILEADPPPPRRLNRNISPDLEAVIMHAIEKDPAQRYPTMEAFGLDLSHVLEGEPVAARRLSWGRRCRKWLQRRKVAVVVALSAAAVIVVAALALLAVAEQREREHRRLSERFTPWREAIQWPGQSAARLDWKWCMAFDPGDPGGDMLRALFAIDAGDLTEAADHLTNCILKCRERRRNALENDALYLLTLVESADEGADETDATRPRFSEAAAPGSASADSFIWRTELPPDLSPAAATERLELLRLNETYYLIDFYLGLASFHELYKGGERHVFERTIRHLERVLESHPRNVVALATLGRTYYFFARFHGFLELIDDAEKWTLQALAAAGDDPHYMILNTLGVICLVRGENQKALDFNLRGLETARNYRNPQNIHNVLGGIGKVMAREGRLEEARSYYERGLAIMATDPPLNVALAEVYLFEGDYDRALQVIMRVLGTPTERSSHRQWETRTASIFLMCSRIHLARKDYTAAQQFLTDLYEKAIHSPRDFGLACHLIATFPEEFFEEKGSGQSLRRLVLGLSGPARERCWLLEDVLSPIDLSTLGTYWLVQGEYAKAIESFDRAIVARSGWGAVGDYQWTESASDLYLLAMAHSRLARESPDKESNRGSQAADLFEQAEALYRSKPTLIETADIIERVRWKARSVLGMD